jgi:hypothetical protein
MDQQRTRLPRWLLRRQDPEFEVWEAAGDGHAYFMVASRLTRREALATATALATARPRPGILVVDGRGTPVHRTGSAAPPATARPGQRRRPAPVAAAAATPSGREWRPRWGRADRDCAPCG